MDFYEKNKKLFSRITREYRKGLNIMLPKFSEIEMKYWDHTMTYIHLNRKSMEDLEDEEDLFFNL